MTSATVIPATYALVIPQKATLREEFEFPFSGSGKTVVAQVWSSGCEPRELLFQLTVVVTQLTPTLKVRLEAPWTVTKTVTKDAAWDLLIINSDGTRDHYLRGPAPLDERSTEALP
jgi:hypothetical protein